MANSTLDPDLIGGSDRRLGIGHDNDALGPGDTSDSGSDVSGLTPPGVDTDSHGTGERQSVDPDGSRQDNDIRTDRIRASDDEAGEDDDEESGTGSQPEDPALNDELQDLESDPSADEEE
jgi:hypothetical protein